MGSVSNFVQRLTYIRISLSEMKMGGENWLFGREKLFGLTWGERKWWIDQQKKKEEMWMHCRFGQDPEWEMWVLRREWDDGLCHCGRHKWGDQLGLSQARLSLIPHSKQVIFVQINTADRKPSFPFSVDDSFEIVRTG